MYPIFSSTQLLIIFFSTAVSVSSKKLAAPEISCSFSKHSSSSSQDPAPIISMPAQRGLSHNGFSTSGREEMTDNKSSAPSFTDQPIFFRSVLNNSKENYSIPCICLIMFYSPNREFRFTAEVPIRLDYHGKHVSMEQVPVPREIFINFI